MTGDYGCPRTGIKKWFDSVQHNHEDIRKAIGGIRSDIEIELEDKVAVLSSSSCRHIYAKINEIMPYYAEDYGGNKVFCSPEIVDGGKTFKTSKHIMTYAKRLKIPYSMSDAALKELNNLVAKLGEKWESAKTHKQSLVCSLKTSAKGFLLLSYYNVDSGSCYRGSADRYTLASREDTFVILVKEKLSEDEKKYPAGILARAWGKLNQAQGIVTISNYYNCGKNFPRGNAIGCFKKQAAVLLGIPEERVAYKEAGDSLRKGRSAGVYVNGDSLFFFEDGKEIPETQTL